MKIYTRSGDEGNSSLYDGSRISKSEIFFDVLGELDELSSRIGFLSSLLSSNDNLNYIFIFLRIIQGKIQDINTIIATIKTKKVLPKITDYDILLIEQQIDNIEKNNEPLTKFILPGVTQLDSQSHLCRTQARKVERYLWKLHNSKDNIIKTNGVIELKEIVIDSLITSYINRLSDFFFVLARFLCKSEGFKDYFQE
jgi:cob(I)alamin adenosyltransferase